MADETCVTIRTDSDIVLACQKGRTLAARAGFSPIDQVGIVISISEIARNILNYAGRGQVYFCLVHQAGRPGLTVMARDQGPGINDIEQALQDGYSTGQSLGLGLPGARRLMDDFEIISSPGSGTTITMTKWTAAGL